jgi:hypothetical protein
MKSVQRPLGNDTLYRRIDDMQMSAADRARAKAQLRAAEGFADVLCGTLAAIRSSAAFVARHVRTALAPSPQH